jgi:hypothetical protein
MTRSKQKGPAEQSRLLHDPWEEAYLRFESPEEEVRKFIGRLKFLRATEWPRDARIVELFCGRGSGLRALDQLGFTQAEGLKDILIVQGGLHHLPVLPEDLDQVLAAAARVLKDDGLLILVEPWPTPFLSLVHALCRSRVIRMLSPKINALAAMIYYERETYKQWLSQPKLILDSLHKAFQFERCHFRWGKIYFAGRKRT